MIVFLMNRVPTVCLCVTSACKLYTKPITSTLLKIMHLFITCWFEIIFGCNVFLSKFTSVLFSRLDIVYNNFIAVVVTTKAFNFNSKGLSTTISLNNRCFSRKKKRPRYSISSFCIEKLNYFLFVFGHFLLEIHQKGTQIQIHLN